MLFALGLCLLFGCKGDAKQGSAAQRSPTAGSTGFNGSAAYSYAKAQVDFGPRVPGTPAAQRAGDWIIRQMRARADTVIVLDAVDDTPLPLVTVSVTVKVPAREY